MQAIGSGAGRDHPKGWVRRERSPEARRLVHCHLTRAGARLLAVLDDAMDEADDRAMNGVSRAEQRRLVGILDRVRAQLKREL